MCTCLFVPKRCCPQKEARHQYPAQDPVVSQREPEWEVGLSLESSTCGCMAELFTGQFPWAGPESKTQGPGVPGSSRRLCLLLTEHEVDQKLVWDPGAPSPLLQSALPCSMAPPEEDWAQPMWLSRWV